MIMESYSSVIGWAGAALVVSAYFLVSSKRVAGDNLTYQLMNIFGAVGVAINSYFQEAYPSVGIQIVWLLIGFTALISIFKLNRNSKTPGEKPNSVQYVALRFVRLEK